MDNFAAAIEHYIAACGVKPSMLRAEWQRLSEDYRGKRGSQPLEASGESAFLAYLATRAPATYAAACQVIRELQRQHIPGPQSVLDMGAGPGTWVWAVAAHDFDLSQIQFECWEAQPTFVRIGKKLARELALHSDPLAALDINWRVCDLLTAITQPGPARDWVVMSYVLGELPRTTLADLFPHIWRRVGQIMIMVEPGTPDGFERLNVVRNQALAAGAVILAPCTGLAAAGECVLKTDSAKTGAIKTGDWCHFSARLPRSFAHRSLKQASLSYEDEKYAYLVIAKKRPDQLESAPRLIKPLQRRGGHIVAELCGGDTLERRIVGRSDPMYRTLRHTQWGDVWPTEQDFGQACSRAPESVSGPALDAHDDKV
jgi:ribosomal protein RSM22 (predicted rRNA methylase)